jgi:LPS sulfotransferase NodH
MFCDVLSNTGEIGLCEEWFNVHYIGAYLTVMGKADVNMVDYLTFVAQKTVRDTGVFAAHSHCYQLLRQGEVFGVSLDNMQFDFVVYIARRDKLAQAVSLATALATDRWRHDEEKSKDEVVTMEGCMEALNEFKVYEEAYLDHFAGKTDAVFAYEDFSQSGHTKSFNKVLAALGKAQQCQFSTSLKVQRTATSRQLKEQFARYLETQ